MRYLILSVVVALCLQYVCCDDVATTKKCESYLPENVCQSLRNVAVKFHEKAAIVNQAVTDAFNHHKTKAAEMLNYVKEYLVARANNFKCEDYISPENCAKAVDLGKKLKLTATQVSVAIKEAIVNGATKASDIYNKAVIYMRDRLSNLQCKDVIGQTQCDLLAKMAGTIKVKVSEINTAIREAVIEGANTAQDYFQKAMAFLETEAKCDAVLGKQTCDKMRTAATELGENIKVVHQAVVDALNKHLTNAGEILKSVQEYLVDKATNFKCSNVMSEDKCNKITEIGQKFKLKAADISRAVKEAIVNSPAKAKEIYDRTVGELLNKVQNLKCEDMLSASTCTQIREKATQLGAKASDVAAAAKEAIVSGANTAKDYVKQATEYLKAKLSCENVMSADTCDKIRKWADKFHVSLKEVDAFLRQAVSNGITKVSDLYKAAIEYITDKWLGIFGDEPLRERRDLQDYKEKAKEIATKVLDALKVKSKKIRDYVKDLIEKGKLKVSEIIRKIKELVQNFKSTDALYDAQDYKEKLKEFATKIFNFLKIKNQQVRDHVNDLIEKGKLKFGELKQKIKEAIENYKKNNGALYDVQDFKETAKEVASNILNLLHVKSRQVIDEVKHLIDQGKVKISELKQKIKELIEKYKGSNGADDAIAVHRRSIKEEIVETLKKVHGKTKEVLEKILKMTKEQFAKVKSWIKEKLETDGITTRGDELDADFDNIQDVIKVAAEETFNNIVADAVKMTQQA